MSTKIWCTYLLKIYGKRLTVIVKHTYYHRALFYNHCIDLELVMVFNVDSK